MYQRAIEIDLPKAQTIDIKFENITWDASMNFHSTKKTVLNGISGCFKSGELTAIMGPSGAGKSSLLNVLTGFHDLNNRGNITYVNNNTKDDGTANRKVACYIQQDDRLYPIFTIDECMKMATNLKLGNSLNNKAKEKLIHNILKTLDLIKNIETRCDRLSGGQKKRLSVALELIDNPPIMFLDEPTTGLDSSSTLQCIGMLQSLSRAGRTIVCTIHQPSAAIYEMFDHVYVLADGKCVYQGAPTNTVDYLSSIGLQCPKYHNPADYMIEVVSKEYGNFNEKLAKLAGNDESIDRWRTSLFVKSPIYITNGKTATQHTNNEQKAKVLIHPPSEYTRFWILLHRCIILLYRDWTVTHLKFIINFLVGILLGLFYVNAGSDGSKTINNIGFLLITVLYLCYTSMMPAVLRFPLELPILKKEKFNNWYKLRTYYIASIVANLPIQILFAVVYSSGSYFLSSQPADLNRFAMFLIVAILTTLVSEAMGLIIGTTFNPVNGTFCGAVFTCTMLIFTGFMAFFNDMPKFMYYASYLSYLRYSMGALVDALYGFNRKKLPCSKDYCHFRTPTTLLDELSMPLGQYWFDISILFVNFIILRIVAYWTLKRYLSK